MHLFPQKSWPSFYSRRALKTQRPPTPLRLFHCQNKVTIKQIKRSAVSGQLDTVKFLFSVHTITELCNKQGGGSSSQVIWPGAPWCSAATVSSLLSFRWIEDQPRVWEEVTHFVPRRTTAFFNKLHVPDSVRSSQFMVFGNIFTI